MSPSISAATQQVGEAGIGKRGYRIFLGVGVVVAEQKDVGVARAGRIGRQPRRELRCGACPNGGAVPLPVSGVRSVTSAAFALEVVHVDDEPRPVGGGVALSGTHR